MTIFLPQELSLFRQAFDATCERILLSKEDEVFYVLLIDLILKIREHTLLKKTIYQLEDESSKRQKQFSVAAFDAYQVHWKQLWKYHHHNYGQRKILARIKRIVTSSKISSPSSLHCRLKFAIKEFCLYSPFFQLLASTQRLFRIAQYDMQCWINTSKYLISEREGLKTYRKIAFLTVSKQYTRKKLHRKIEQLAKLKDTQKFSWRTEIISTQCLSLSLIKIERNFQLPGENGDQKRRNMHIKAETDITYCWERLRFLEQCYSMPSAPLISRHYPGKWQLVKDIAWDTAWRQCEQEIILWAKRQIQKKLHPSYDPLYSSFDSMDTFFSCENQIHRKDFEMHLKAMQQHIHTQLLIIESSMQSKTEESFGCKLPGTLKSNFVIDLAVKYRKIYPFAKHAEAFEYYQCNCPPQLQLGWDRWYQIILEQKLDPRSLTEKVRGPGKKSCKK